jgi:hypothetical protein
MATDIDVLKTYEDQYNQGYSKISEFQEEGRRDIEYFLNKQFSDAEENYLRSEGRECIVNNKIRRAIMLISGFQRMNRMSSVVIPQGDENQEVADIVSNAIQWIYSKRDGYHHLSDCYLYGSLISGINFSEIVLDYSQDPNVPDINFERIPYNGAIWDPYFTNLDMSDCAYFIRRKLVSKNNVLSFLPDHASEIKKMKAFGGDGKFTDIPAYTNPTGQELLAYTEHWERDIEKRLIILDNRTQEYIGMVNREEEELAEALVAFDPNRTLIRRTVPTVKLNIIINDQVVEKTHDPIGINEYPFVPLIGIYMPEHDDFRLRLQSVLRVARDPQSELNKRISKFLDIMDSKTHSGWLFKKKAIAEGEDPYRGGNFRSLALKSDAVIGLDIAPIIPPPSDPSLMQSIPMFDQNIMDSIGLNDAAFGVPESGNDSGLLTMLRQQSSVVGLQSVIDNFNKSHYIHIRKVIKTIQRRWPAWKWERVTGKKVNNKIYDSSFLKFDAYVTQGIETENQQKMFFGQLMQLRQMGVNIPDSIIIKYAPLQDKGSLLKDIQQIEQQQAQQQQQQQELMQQQLQLASAKTLSDIKKTESETEENKADTVRSTSRAYADIALSQAHTAESVQKRANASLDMVKAALEIQNAQESRFVENLSFITGLTDKYKQENNEEMLLNKAIVDSLQEGSFSSQDLVATGALSGAI